MDVTGLTLTLTVDHGVDRDLVYARQLSVTQIVARVQQWDEETLAAAHHRVVVSGFTLAGVVGLSSPADGSGRDEAVAHLQERIESAGRAGVPWIGLPWRAPDGDEGWATLGDTLERLDPALHQAQVRLALRLEGDAVSADAWQRLADSISSDYIGLDLCLGDLAGASQGLFRTVDALYAACPIYAVHVRGDRRGLAPREPLYSEGQSGLLQALLALQRAGYGGTVRPGHSPRLTDDTPEGHTAHAYDLGYLRSLLQALRQLA